MRALVLSGGGLFGAWQAGAWSVVARDFQPDLIVGASIGSLNGYLIAAGARPAEILSHWRNPEFGDFGNLRGNLRLLTSHYQLRRPLAITVTDLLRMQPLLFRDAEITADHLAASCAVPLLLPQVRVDGRLCSDGGLLGPLPLWAAKRLGATEVVALHVLEQFPSPWLEPLARGFVGVFGRRTDSSRSSSPGGATGAARMRVRTLSPGRRLGYLRDTIQWKADNIERWIEQGVEEAEAAAANKSFSI